MLLNGEDLVGFQQRKFEINDYGEYTDAFMSNQKGGMKEEIENNYGKVYNEAKKLTRKKKPTYDFNTKNKSFMDLYNDLYHMGIKNNKFFLRIYDTDLIGINPYQSILPLDLQLKILVEIMINPWYYLREVCRIPEDGKPIEIGGGTAYQIDRNNVAAWYLFLNGIDEYCSKPRQTGKTQDAIAKFVYAYHFGTMAATFLFFNKDQKYSKDNLMRFKSQRDMLPAYLQMRIEYNDDGSIDKGIDNMTSMRNPITKNQILLMPKAVSYESAQKIGRGNTAALHYYDEFDFTPWNLDIVKAAAFSYSRSSENAKKNNSLYGRLFTSTPGDLATRDGKSANEFIEHMIVWKDSYLDMPINKLKKMANDKESKRNGVVFIEHTWKQLKKSIEWYESACQQANYDENVILREIELHRFNGTSASPFKKTDILYIGKHEKTPIEEIDYSKNLCPIEVYEKLHHNYPYILSCDPSDGLAEDNNAMTLINPYTLKPVAEFQSPYISQHEMCNMIVQFMDNRCPYCMIVVESNKGRELINCLLNTKYRYRVWYDDGKISKQIVEEHDEYSSLRKRAMDRRALGFVTSPSTRPKLFAILENFMYERKDCICTKYIVKDVMGLERKPNGRIEASGTNHDDNIMSYLFGLYVYNFSSNLESFGLSRGAQEPKETPEEETDQEKKEKIRNILPNLPEELRSLFEGIATPDEIERSEDYAKEVQREDEKHDFLENGESITGPNQSSPSDNDNLWNALDNTTLYSNTEHQDEFNIDDYI